MVATKFYDYDEDYHHQQVLYQQHFHHPVKPIPTYYNGQYGKNIIENK